MRVNSMWSLKIVGSLCFLFLPILVGALPEGFIDEVAWSRSGGVPIFLDMVASLDGSSHVLFVVEQYGKFSVVLNPDDQ